MACRCTSPIRRGRASPLTSERSRASSGMALTTQASEACPSLGIHWSSRSCEDLQSALNRRPFHRGQSREPSDTADETPFHLGVPTPACLAVADASQLSISHGFLCKLDAGRSPHRTPTATGRRVRLRHTPHRSHCRRDVHGSGWSRPHRFLPSKKSCPFTHRLGWSVSLVQYPLAWPYSSSLDSASQLTSPVGSISL